MAYRLNPFEICVLQLSLWGNRCDLSISGGEDNAQKSNPLHQLGQLDQFLLANDFDDAWDYLLSLRKKAETTGSRVDIIMDNAGTAFSLRWYLSLAIFMVRRHQP